MASSLFKLWADLGAKDNISGTLRKIRNNIGPLKRDLSSVGKSAVTFGSGLTRLVAPLGAITSVVSIAGVSSLIKSTAELGDKMANTAKETGLSATMLQEYSYVVQSCNMESDDFLSAMVKMNSNMGKLRQGTGPLVSDLGKISPALAKQIKAASSNEEAFNLMLESLRKIPDADRRARLASIYFGESNAKMANLADLSADQLAKLQTEAHELGLVLDKDALASSQAFNDSMTKMRNSSRGLSVTIGSTLLPVVTPLIDKLSDWVIANRSLIASRAEKYVEQFATWIGRVDLDKTLNGITRTIDGLGKFIDFIGGTRNALILLFVLMNGGLISSFFRFGASIFSLGSNSAGAILGLAGMKTGLLALLGPLGLIAAGIGTVIALYKMLGDQADNVGMATLGVDNEGNAQYLTTDQTAFAYHTGTARVGGTWSPSNPNSKVYQEAQAADARRNAANYGLTAAISAAAPVQKSQADITVDFKNVPKGTDIDYSTSGEGTNLTLDVETNAPTQ